MVINESGKRLLSKALRELLTARNEFNLAEQKYFTESNRIFIDIYSMALNPLNLNIINGINNNEYDDKFKKLRNAEVNLLQAYNDVIENTKYTEINDKLESGPSTDSNTLPDKSSNKLLSIAKYIISLFKN